jgi:uncharacterized membrane protein
MTKAPPSTSPGTGSPRRLEMLTDGIVAIVMTLIVLQIAIPGAPTAQLPHDLRNLLPTLLVYGLLFVALVPFVTGLYYRGLAIIDREP